MISVRFAAPYLGKNLIFWNFSICGTYGCAEMVEIGAVWRFSVTVWGFFTVVREQNIRDMYLNLIVTWLPTVLR